MDNLLCSVSNLKFNLKLLKLTFIVSEVAVNFPEGVKFSRSVEIAYFNYSTLGNVVSGVRSCKHTINYPINHNME